MKKRIGVGLGFVLASMLAAVSTEAAAGDYQLRAKADEPIVVLDQETGRIWLLKSEGGVARMVPVLYDDGQGRLSATPPAAAPSGTPLMVSPEAEPEPEGSGGQ